jgi:multidrug efflux pump subunit AcrA (membrane-fusion protein)
MTEPALDKAQTSKKQADETTGGATKPPPTKATQEPPPSPRPPRGPSRRAVFAWLVFGLVMLFVGITWGDLLAAPFVGAWEAIRAGNGDETTDLAADDDGAPEYYTCGMHPWVILPEPGLCPICHMDLTPLDPDKFTGEITIDPVVTQSIGVRIEPVSKGPVVQTIRTVGTVDYDETRVRDVNIKTPGWIEKLYVDYLGAEVEVGQPLFDLYSPDLYEAQEQYLIEFRKRRTAPDALPKPGGQVDLLDSARTRLEFFDITPEQIRQLEANGVPSKTMAINTPYRGIVTAKHANEGMRVDEGMQVYRIADLTKVWVMVTLYEYQLPFVQTGQRAVMKLSYIPGQRFEGKVIYVYPYLDPQTRQVSVRLEFDNPNLLLKPGMYANVELQSTLAAERTLVPRSAILDTGERQIAFVSLGEGRFEPRDLLVGVETGDGTVEILDGLKPGEMVVTSGQFLLDSEANIREGLAKMLKGTMAAEQTAVVAVTGASELAALPPGAESTLNGLMTAYFAIGDTLAGDSIEGIADRARALSAEVDRLLEIEIPQDPHFWHRHDEVATVRGEAIELIDSADLAAARLHFADLSVAMAKLVRATGVPPTYGKTVQELHCPMYREGQGGSTWLQSEGSPRNPFFGSLMLECFDERSALPVTGASAPGPANAEEGTSAAPPAPADEAGITLYPDAREQLDKLFAGYLGFQDALTRDALEEAAAHLAPMRQAATVLSDHRDPAMTSLAARVADGLGREPADLDQARQILEAVFDAFLELGAIAPPGESVAPALFHVYCPMVKKSWLQASREVANPYAPYMLRCGQIKGTLAARGTE